MKAFFKSMNLARGIILAALLGSVVLLWIGLRHASRLSEMKQNYSTDVAKIAPQLAQLARKHSQLTEGLKGESLQGEANLQEYIYKVGTMDRVEVGNLDLVPSKPDPIAKGVVDKAINIRPDNRDRAFERTKIANFLYTIEAQSRRVKVTMVKIENADRRVKPQEIPKDQWTFEAEITSRQRSEP
jgi:hypothetical protein